MERTLSIIKPDGVARGLIGEVIRRLEKSNFKNKVYKGYLDIAGINKDRFTVIDGEKNIEDIFEEIKSKVEKYLQDKR